MSGSTLTLARPAAGFFGKLPSRGDFIGRHLPKSFLEPWDDWLQAAMAESRNQLGEAWRDSYCISPIWRFAIGDGLCGSVGYAGVLMPSVDRVNRYYPLVIAAPLTPDWPLLTLPTMGEAWFQQAERLALEALEQDALDLEDFSQRVSALGAPPDAGLAESGPPTGNAWHCPLPDALNLSRTAPALAGHLLRRAFTRPSLWWTEGSDCIARCLLICDGLPPIEGFAALLAGDWEKRGWNKKPLAGFVAPDESSATEEEASL